MSEIRKRHFACTNLDDEPPEKKLISDADIFVKQLSESQLNTKVTLQSELARGQEFTKAVELEPLGNYISGTTTLESFKKTTNHVEQVEMLKAAGLFEKDIELYFDSLKGQEFLSTKYKNCEVSSLKQKLCEMNTMVRKYQEKSHNLVMEKEKPSLLDHGLTVKPDSMETKLMKFALENQKPKASVLPHPMDQLEEIEKNRFSNLNYEHSNNTKIRRKARKLCNRINNLEKNEILTNNFQVKLSNIPVASNSKWDVKEKCEEIPKIVDKKVYSCKPQNNYTVKNGEIVKLDKVVEVEEKGLDVQPKLSLDEIKLLLKFKNYKVGTPSKILYLKNLPLHINEEDLKKIFRKFDTSEEVTYRVLQGKMRGQAFVTFQDADIASKALEDINGSYIKNKPIIIEYGKST